MRVCVRACVCACVRVCLLAFVYACVCDVAKMYSVCVLLNNSRLESVVQVCFAFFSVCAYSILN